MAPDFSSSAFDTNYIAGVGALDERMLIPVDIEKIIGPANMGQFETATTAAH